MNLKNIMVGFWVIVGIVSFMAFVGGIICLFGLDSANNVNSDIRLELSRCLLGGGFLSLIICVLTVKGLEE